jgi:hypothetical protein
MPLKTVARTIALNHQLGLALQIVAGAMPVRRSIWWAALCLLHSFESSITEIEREILVASASWALEPAESWKSLARHFFQTRPAVRPAFSALNSATVAVITNPATQEAGGWLATVGLADAVLQAVPELTPELVQNLFFIDLGNRVAEGELLAPNAVSGGSR